MTDLEASRQRADALSEISALLAGSLDFDATVQLIAGLAVPRLADWCFVELLRDDGSIERAAIEAVDPEVLERAREYDRRYPLDPDAPWGSPQVIRSGEPDLPRRSRTRRWHRSRRTRSTWRSCARSASAPR